MNASLTSNDFIINDNFKCYWTSTIHFQVQSTRFMNILEWDGEQESFFCVHEYSGKLLFL